MFVNLENGPQAVELRRQVPIKLAQPPWNYTTSLEQNITVRSRRRFDNKLVKETPSVCLSVCLSVSLCLSVSDYRYLS
jgi:hypothetical protein